MKKLEDYVTSIPDFPKEGIIFRDISSVIGDPDGLELAINTLMEMLEFENIDVIAAPESRGFIFGMPLAYELHKGFVMIRKKGKLPRATVSQSYTLEYGQAEVEIHKDAIKPGQRVVLIDDLLATGGTMEANIRLVESLGGIVVRVLFLIELDGLGGRARLKDYDVESAIVYTEKG